MKTLGAKIKRAGFLLATVAVVLATVAVAHATAALGAEDRVAPDGAAPPSPAVVQETLRRAVAYLRSIATDGGYVWVYSSDLSRRAGESITDANHIWFQPPGTPSVGMAFLRAYRATGEKPFLAAAEAVARAVRGAQLDSGGWHYSADMKHPERNRDGLLDYKGRSAAERMEREKINPLYTITSVYDDDNTPSVVRFLLACDAAECAEGQPPNPEIRATLLKALDGMLRAQYPNGAWPEQDDGRPRDPARHPIGPARFPAVARTTWPGDQSYTRYYTLNDNVPRQCITTLLAAWRQLGDARYLAAARRGGDFLVLAQLPEPQRGWAQQYDFQMEPAWARVFEPPAVASFESGGALQALMTLHLETGDPRYLEPIAPALRWLERSTSDHNAWARLNEFKTNRPIYGDVDGAIHYDLATVSPKRRTGYGWHGAFHLPEITAECRELLRLGREDYRARLAAKSKTRSDRDAAGRKVNAVIRNLDAHGRWLADGRLQKNTPVEKVISTKVFIANVNGLCDYLESREHAVGRAP
jgi:Pectic acid lyase